MAHLITIYTTIYTIYTTIYTAQCQEVRQNFFNIPCITLTSFRSPTLLVLCNPPPLVSHVILGMDSAFWIVVSCFSVVRQLGKLWLLAHHVYFIRVTPLGSLWFPTQGKHSGIRSFWLWWLIYIYIKKSLTGWKSCPIPDHPWHSQHRPHPILRRPNSILTKSP